MTPAARIAAAIEVLDQVQRGAAAEAALTRWARASRFAGSKDRAAVRDHVFDVLRVKRSAAHVGGGNTGRAILLGLLRLQSIDPNALFTGQGHAPSPLSDTERDFNPELEQQASRWNIPDWMVASFEESLGDRAEETAVALQSRAPITLRVNAHKTTKAQVQDELHKGGIETEENALSATALTVTENARRIRQTSAFLEGRIELQDASSQAVCDLIPDGLRVLDMCAGGGGKSLALAAQENRQVYAHDIAPARMNDLPDRARRAGVAIERLSSAEMSQKAPYDVILCDAPCSGSGAWRRSPEGKWALTPERLKELTAIQDRILDQAAGLLAPGGTLVYATCSVFAAENENRIAHFFSRHSGWAMTLEKRFDVSAFGDGFFTVHLTQE